MPFCNNQNVSLKNIYKNFYWIIFFWIFVLLPASLFKKQFQCLYIFKFCLQVGELKFKHLLKHLGMTQCTIFQYIQIWIFMCACFRNTKKWLLSFIFQNIQSLNFPYQKSYDMEKFLSAVCSIHCAYFCLIVLYYVYRAILSMLWNKYSTLLVRTMLEKIPA
jgi:hypothetical protein